MQWITFVSNSVSAYCWPIQGVLLSFKSQWSLIIVLANPCLKGCLNLLAGASPLKWAPLMRVSGRGNRKMSGKTLGSMCEEVWPHLYFTRLCALQVPVPRLISGRCCQVCDAVSWYILGLCKCNLLNESIGFNEQVAHRRLVMLLYMMSSNLIISDYHWGPASSLKILNGWASCVARKWTSCAFFCSPC